MRHVRPCPECGGNNFGWLPPKSYYTDRAVFPKYTLAEILTGRGGRIDEPNHTIERVVTSPYKVVCCRCKGTGKIGPVATHPLEPGPRRQI